jgi:molybdenum cofactor cytidylyltransferase
LRAALVLAAGRSRRFGSRDKLKAQVAGKSLLDHAVARAWASGAARVLIVGAGYLRVQDAERGMGASLIAGLRALRPIEREVFVFLADMPFAAAPKRLRFHAGEGAVRPVVKGVPGHPMLVRTAIARALARPTDKGLAGLDRVRRVRGTTGNILDIDTPETLARIRYRIAGAGGALGVRKRGLPCSAKPQNGSRLPRR